ncbi:metallophosphoesterase [Sporosarcina cyprini]|uniref:metallophosphoesterase n=1 Tax=Sporosarcina cyprini TaxID=2910523 RepID=UPI001EDFA139|nr:metallophosphoesterase [Sporosarcina cyprini]MCG3086436.1 metallophosphoesterase [Sporosarcina cyprini]
MIDIRTLELDENRRIIIISDIHANLPLFKRLLGKVNYTPEDYLFINGDLCEKGPDSLATVAYVRELSAASDRVFITKGNCDIVHRYVFDHVEGIRNYMAKQPYSILNEILVKQDKQLDHFSTLEELGEFYQNHYGETLDWLESLPVAFETDEFILIHAGVENRPDWQNTSLANALSMPSFYEQGHMADKTIIVGHWPVVNYRAGAISSNSPVIDVSKKIIALDGGNCIKRDGQLNALIWKGNDTAHVFVDELPVVEVKLAHQDQTGNCGTVTYPNYEVQELQRDSYFTLCENKNLGIQQWVKNEYIVNGMCKSDVSTTFLSVERGECVSIVNETCEGFTLVKKEDGSVGWIPKECVE